MIICIFFFHQCEKKIREDHGIVSNKIEIDTGKPEHVGYTFAIIPGFLRETFGQEITEYGHCWDIHQSPTIDKRCNSFKGTNVSSDFISEIADLEPGVNYFIRGYYIIENNVIYGNQQTFSTHDCPSSITDYEGNKYRTILIGEQCWMKENLKSTRYSTGESLEDGRNVTNISGDYSSRYFFNYQNLDGWANIVGRLYTYYSATKGIEGNDNTAVQGVCPDGWHIPSDDEWKELEFFLGMSDEDLNLVGKRGTDQANELKNIKGACGFNALMSGFREMEGEFESINTAAFFWTSTYNGNQTAWYRALWEESPYVYRYGHNANMGFSVRCIKDMN